MVRKPSKYGHSDALHDYENNHRSKEPPKKDSAMDLPEEPKTDEFRHTYEANLGRHSVNYGAWFAVKDDGFFSDYWDTLEGKISHKEFFEKYPDRSKFTISAIYIKTGHPATINGESRMGNIESLFGGEGVDIFHRDHFLPFLRVETGDYHGDGFTVIGTNKLFPRRGSLTLGFVDNDHWPALRRGSAILINEKYVPKEWYGNIIGEREKGLTSPVVNSICIDCKHFDMEDVGGCWYCDYYKEGTSEIPEEDHCEHYEKKEE